MPAPVNNKVLIEGCEPEPRMRLAVRGVPKDALHALCLAGSPIGTYYSPSGGHGRACHRVCAGSRRWRGRRGRMR